MYTYKYRHYCYIENHCIADAMDDVEIVVTVDLYSDGEIAEAQITKVSWEDERGNTIRLEENDVTPCDIEAALENAGVESTSWFYEEAEAHAQYEEAAREDHYINQRKERLLNDWL